MVNAVICTKTTREAKNTQFRRQEIKFSITDDLFIPNTKHRKSKKLERSAKKKNITKTVDTIPEYHYTEKKTESRK